VRERWRAALLASQTVGEIAMGLYILEDLSDQFGVVIDIDINAPIMLAASKIHLGASSKHSSNNKRSSANNEGNIQTQSNHKRTTSKKEQHQQQRYHELGSRQAKKNALSNIARCTREENEYTSSGHSRSAGRNTRSNRNDEDDDDYDQQQDYVSSRPTRSSAQRVQSYAE
jgi:hypothetical protein